MFDHKRKTINDKINTEGFEFKNSKDAVGKDGLTCWGYLQFKSQYGEGVALCCSDNTFYRLPQRYVQTFKEATDEDLDFVMSGQPVSFRIMTTDKGDTVIPSINGMDI